MREFTRRAAQNEVAHCITCNFDVVEGPEKVDFSFSKNYACSCGVFDGEFGFPILARNTADGAAQVVAVQGLDVFNFKSL